MQNVKSEDATTTFQIGLFLQFEMMTFKEKSTFLSDESSPSRPLNLAAVSMHVLIKFIHTQMKDDIMKEPFKEHFSISSIRADQTEKNIK